MSCPSQKMAEIILKGATILSVALLRFVLHTQEIIDGVKLKNEKRSKSMFDIGRNSASGQCR